jgi:acyl carrier protein
MSDEQPDEKPVSLPANAATIEKTIIGLIAVQKTLDPNIITSSSTFEELQMDSLDKINLSFEVEERFEISIPDDALDSLRTVGDVVAGVQRIQAEPKA